jgi:HlyD family secretion protein
MNADPRKAILRLNAVGLALLLALVGGAGGWAFTTELAGAVIAAGTVVVDSDVKRVQHPTGGVVGELLVRDGDEVEAGQVLVRLDQTITRANLEIVLNSLDQAMARKARLEAERDDATEIAFPPELIERAADPDVTAIMAGEKRLFELRAEARSGQIAQLRERSAQLDDEMKGLDGQLAAKDREIELLKKELAGVRDLWEKNLITIQRVTEAERDLARLEGERGELVASIAQAGGRKTEVGLQIIQIDQELRSEVAAELREAEGQIAEFEERRTAAQDQLRRVEIRAPQHGRVHQLAVHTVGGVITAGETIMQIVPTDLLTVEVKVNPQDIDSVRPEQTALLRLSAFNTRTTPEINGTVIRISPDIVHDERTGASYYVARIAIPPEEAKKLAGLTLSPGMPVDAFIQTGQRTVISYLMKPLVDQIMHTFREQ